jgi:hypothetical protein
VIASLRIVIPSVAVLLFLAFLVLLVVIARIAGSATRGPKGGERGCLGGCGLFAVILLCCGLAIAGFVAFVATLAGVTAVQHNPIKSIDILLPDASSPARGDFPALRDDEVPVVVHVAADGDLTDAARRVRALLERRFDVDRRAFRNVRTVTGPDGSSLELWFPMRRRDLNDLRRELEAWGVELGGGVRITLDEERGI